jgi:Ca2+-binding RTX toxin-like protein
MPWLQDDRRTKLLPADPGDPNAVQFESAIAAADHPSTGMIRQPWMVARPPAADPPVELGINGRITQAEVDALEAGVDLVLTAIENQLADEVFSETLPLVGNNFRQAWDNNVSSFRFLTAARTQILIGLSSFSSQADYDPAAVASAIKSRLTTYAGFPTTITVSATTLNDEAQVAFVITRNYSATDVAIETDIGLPNLAIRLNGSPVARTTVSPSLSFTIGVDGSGFYLQTNGSSFQLNTTTTISSLNVAGSFAGLPHQITRDTVNPTNVPANFAITLKDPGNDGKLRGPELGGNPDLLDATLTGSTKVTLKIDSSFPSSAMVPRAGSDLQLLWDFSGAAVDPGDQNTHFGGKPSFSLENNRVNLSSFLNSFASKALGQIEDATEPFRPVIDVLTAPIPLLSDLGSQEVTFLDVMGVEDTTVAAIGGLDDILDLATLASSLNPSLSTTVDLGAYTLASGDPRTDALADMPGTPSRSPSNTRPADLNTFMNSVASVSGLAFPLLADPNVVANLLLGRPAELFSYQSGEIGFSESFQQFYPVLGPVGVTLGGTLGLKTQFGFGYDTQGVIDYYEDGGTDSGLLANGFYAMALDESGNPLTGILMEAGITAGVEVNLLVASAGVEGDLTATIGIYLDDLLGDEKGRIRGNVFSSVPMDDWFYAAGSLSAGLHAYLEIGWPPFGVSFDFDSPRVVLITYDSRDQTMPVLAETDPVIPGALILNVGERAPRRLYGDTDDRAEEFILRKESNELVVNAFNRESPFSMPTLIVGDGNLRGDLLSVAEDVNVPVRFTGGDGYDVLRGGAADDNLSGGAGPDLLNGRSGNDILDGGADHDELVAGDGNDTFIGGDGIDTASWSGASIPVVIDLRTATFAGAAAGDTFSSIERYQGSAHNDTIDGSDGADSLLHGSSGNDTVRGHGGGDLVDGGDGDDLVDGGAGNDMLVGGPGADQLDGGEGSDIASYLGAKSPVSVSLLNGTGTRGDALGDTLTHIEILMGSGLPDEFGSALVSGDMLEGGDGDDTIYGMDGADEIRGSGGNDILWGNHPDIPGAPRLGYDDDEISGGAGNDAIHGQAGNDELDGNQGNDTLLGGSDNDHLLTMDPAGIDNLDGESGINRLSADYTDKTVPFQFTVGQDNSFAFPDGDQFQNIQTLGTLLTGSGNDVIRLAATAEQAYWNKTIDAGPGDDLVITDWRGYYGLAGGPTRTSDNLAGGDGIDTVSFEQAIAGVSVSLATNVVGGSGTGITISGFENIVGTNFTDTLTGDAQDNILMPLLGGPNPDATPRNDYVHGGDGIDTLRVDYSSDPRVNAEGISMTPNQTTGYEGIALGPNWSVGNVSMVLYYLGIERFEITGGAASDRIYGESAAAYADRFFGMGGDDYLDSRGGDDYLDGGDGSDTMLPGLGNDTVHGGPGNDVITFLYGTGGYAHDIANCGPDDDLVTNINSPGNDSTVAGVSTIMQFDGGTGIDTLSADLGHMTDPLVFDEAAPSDFDLPNGGYIRNFEIFRDVTTGSGNDRIVLRDRRNNRLALRGGNDICNPGLGNDAVNGGTGEDMLILDYSVGDDEDTGPITRQGSTSFFERRRISTGTLLDQISSNGFEKLVFTGTSKNDIFDGYSGDDIMRGGAGNDTLTGSNGNDLIFGEAGNDTLTGNSHNDWLDGGPGADTMNGAQNNDTYIVDDPGDDVVESAAQYGTDTVRASIDFTLPTHVEHLVLTGGALNGTGNGGGNQIIGNPRNNDLRGESGNDTLDGGGGSGEQDRLNGGPGADTFVLGAAGLPYYDNRDPGNPGHDGYALIEDFTPSQTDKLRLAGAAANYLLGISPFPEVPGTAVYLDSDGNGTLDPAADELIAILQSPEPLTVANTLTNGTFNQAVDPALVGLTAPLVGKFVDEPSGRYFAIEFSVFDPLPTGVLLELQSSTDLGESDPWLTIASKNGAGTWTGMAPIDAVPAGNGRVTVTVRAMHSILSEPRLFMRWRLTGP